MKTKVILLTALISLIGISCRQTVPATPAQPETAAQPVDYQKMITARVYVKPGKEADFISAAKMMIENSNKEEGCLGYMLYQDPYESTNFIFVEKYKNQAAIDAHFASPYFKEFGNVSSEMTSKPMEIKIYDLAGEK
ncbi:MAG TPA: putative quinol monooxygenase [Bacteroidales bacterium]|jgi:quinol monooxygenase YgiN|nr:putative quinol monooxygenase [Bacteroidales bacterium]